MATNQPKEIRASALSSYNDCARRSAANLFPIAIVDAGHYLVRPKQNIGAAIGTGTHAAMEYTLRNKIENGGQGLDGEAIDSGIQALRNETENGVYFDEKTAPNINSAEKHVVRNTRILRASVTPLINPVELEVAFSATYRDFLVTGHADVREPSGMGDLKTGKFKRQNAPQYGTYAMLGESMGHEVTSFIEWWLPTAPLDKPAPPPQFKKYNVELCRDMAKSRLDYVIDDYEAFLSDGNPARFRANPESMLCNPKFCAAHGTKFCTEHKQ
jgi:hypothetical protein